MKRALEQTGRPLPVYLSEENRSRDGDAVISADAYARAMRGARQAGATGWVFHTDAGFDLKQYSFLDALSPEEKCGLSLLAAAVKEP